jgi:hypothetical protein
VVESCTSKEKVTVARSVTRSEAELRFKNAQMRKEDAKKAVTEQQAAEQATHEKTARLRALRLAKEAADADEKARQAKLKPATKKRGANGRRALEKTTGKGSSTVEGGAQK